MILALAANLTAADGSMEGHIMRGYMTGTESNNYDNVKPLPFGFPSFIDLRAIQYEYSTDRCLVVLEWKTAGGRFDYFSLSLDGLPTGAVVSGYSAGAKIENLSPGPHEFEVEAIWGEKTQTRKVLLDVLDECPLEPMTSLGCLYYGYDDSSGKGFLQVSWRIPERSLEDPYLEFEIRLDGKFKWRGFSRDGVVTFDQIAQGTYGITLFGITRSYLSAAAEFTCTAQGIPPPQNVWLEVECNGNRARGIAHYDIPGDTRYDSLGIWLSHGMGWEFYGYYQPEDGGILLYELPEKYVEVEVAGVWFEPGTWDPYAISNLPGSPGAHAIAREWINCRGRSEFRRGDVYPDGEMNITDAFLILQYLFIGGEPLPCLPAADIDDSDQLEITDSILLLRFLFTGGFPPALPGPDLCGEDPTPGELQECNYDACGSL